MANREKAFLIAAEIGPVVPLNPSGHAPLVPFDRASEDPEVIHRWWTDWPDAGVGLASWLTSVIVIDVEHPRKGGADGFATLQELCTMIGDLPRTRVHRTKNGGAHLIFALPRCVTLRSAQGKIRRSGRSAPGVDVVAGRAVLRWPPTRGYELECDEPIAMLPGAWIVALSDPPLPILPPKPTVTIEGRERRYALAALEKEAVEFAQLGAGRNCQLTRVAFRLGQLVPVLHTSEIECVLMHACEANGALREHGQRACLSTIARGLRAGMNHPRTMRAA